MKTKCWTAFENKKTNVIGILTHDCIRIAEMTAYGKYEDARLMSCAPELLQALEAMLPHFNREYDDVGDDEWPNILQQRSKAYKLAEKAIKKAKRI
jgi:hypothetical protein